MKQIGYDRPLFVQPFDHRGSFTKTYFGFKGLPTISSSDEQHLQVCEAKTLIYRALLKAIDMGVARDTVGILVDAQYGAHIIADAKAKRIPAAVCVEKTGQNVFDFEYEGRWADHIRYIAPDIVKVLPRAVGLVADSGNVTGHAAALLREFKVPSVFKMPDAFGSVPSGDVVSLDSVRTAVYAGALWPPPKAGFWPPTMEANSKPSSKRPPSSRFSSS